jgi:EAL domain-containing protein (putative c-di-GMP-specific phosphodiesterase class I)
MTVKTDKHYGINISGVSIADNDFCLFVLDLFEKFTIDPSCIGFEITETAAITNIDSAMNFISKLSAIGCHFSLDDFGSGISSFNYLQQLPVHTLKIDGSFICDICDNQLHQVFVETIQRIAQEMNKTTIAEFVESAAIEQKVKSLGIDFAQGYHIHKPEFWFEYSHIRSSV